MIVGPSRGASRHGEKNVWEIATIDNAPFWDDPKMEARDRANARLIAAAPAMKSEMQRFLAVIERAEAEPGTWERLTAGLGVATANAYRAALHLAEQGE